MSDCKYNRTSNGTGNNDCCRNSSNNNCDNNNNCCDNHECCEKHECGTNFREAVCIHTDKIYDSCRE